MMHWVDRPDALYEYLVQSDPSLLEARRRGRMRLEVLELGAATAKGRRTTWRLPPALRSFGLRRAAGRKTNPAGGDNRRGSS